MSAFMEMIRFTNGFHMGGAILRMLLAVILGGLIGIEREHKRRPAGFRTHILICLGATLTTLTSQYIALELHLPTDLARLGAQVIAGIGFIGAGTIIVTRRRQVKGLTTAAGLWTAAIVGIAAGAGCYLEALFACALVLFTELVFSKIEYYLMASARAVNVYVDFTDKKELYRILDVIREHGIEIIDSEISKNAEFNSINAIFTLKFPRKYRHDEIINEILTLESVRQVEEL